MNLQLRHITLDVPHRADALRVEFQTELSQLPSLAAEWDALKCDHDAPFFQSYAWNHHVARIRLQNAPHRWRLFVATVWRESELVAVWPLSLQLSATGWVAHSLDDPFGQFAGVLARTAADIEPCIEAAIEALRDQACGIHIEAVIAGSPFHAALLRHGASAVSAQEAVVVDLRPYESIEAFQRTLNSKTRSNLRNLRNRLHRAHKVESTVLEEATNLGPMLTETFDARMNWMQENGRTSPASRDSDFRTLVRELSGADGIALIGFSWTADDALIAAGWGFIHEGRYYGYVSATNPAFNAFSPGRQHLGITVEDCFSRGIRVLELMAPSCEYKLQWGNRTKKLETLSIPFSLGRHAESQLTRWAVPALRRLSRAMPASLRKHLINQLNKN